MSLTVAAHAALAGTGVLAGLPHRPMGGEDLLERVPADSTRAFDLVMYGVARGWEAMDAGRIDEAADVTAHALARLARPENWPVLLLTHVIALAAAGRSQELETIRLRYLQSATRYARHRSTHWMGPTADFLEVFTSRYVGGPTPGPPDGAPTPVDSRFSFVTVAVTAHDSAPGDVERGASLPDGEGLAKLSLRMRGAVLQVVAIEAMRSDGGEEVALAALRRCYAELGADQLAPIGLALGSREAIDKLCALVRAQPAELGLNRALGAERFAGVPWSEAPPVELSEREAEILAHIREGRSNSVIAKNLYVTVNTVKFHRSNLFRKLGATNRDEAVAASLRLGL